MPPSSQQAMASMQPVNSFSSQISEFLNRHAQIVEDSKIVLKATLKTQKNNDAEIQISIKRAL